MKLIREFIEKFGSYNADKFKIYVEGLDVLTKLDWDCEANRYATWKHRVDRAAQKVLTTVRIRGQEREQNQKSRPWLLNSPPWLMRRWSRSSCVDRSIVLGYSVAMNFGVLFEKVTDKDFPSGYYYAHVPSLGLTTHGLGIEGARQAAADLLRLWIVEKRAHGEAIPQAGETLFSTIELPGDALQSA